ncbi:hypothetical protein [Georgenia wangjunii]|uniref:hypothetical protein n=1 Tax=Georgenia wangjunii TaxID=3117730 RepID=UPI002F262080
MSTEPRVTHLFDCADVGGTLVREARSRRLPWRYVPGLQDVPRREFYGDFYLWTARRISSVARSDLVHLHYGGRTAWVRKFPHRPYVVHLHGSDIRTQYRDPRFHDEIQGGLDAARAVFFATPDLAEAARAARPDATYLPNPIEVAALPTWAPAPRPTVLFPSRWDPVKGLESQLAIARELRRALGADVDLVGLDWGEGTGEAAAAGVRLVPRMERTEFVAWLASAHLAVAQSTGLLGMSELQTLGIGVPTLMADPHPGYAAPPVLDADPAVVGDVARAVLDDPAAVAAQLDPRAWVRRHHGPAQAVDRLRAVYRQVLAR